MASLSGLSDGCATAPPAAHRPTCAAEGAEHYDSASPTTSTQTPPASQPQRSASRRTCRVAGCAEALPPGYCETYRICPTHKTAASFETGGKSCRFCQQCGRVHELAAFDPGRLSCRRSLERHSLARSLRQATAGGGAQQQRRRPAGLKRERSGEQDQQAARWQLERQRAVAQQVAQQAGDGAVAVLPAAGWHPTPTLCVAQPHSVVLVQRAAEDQAQPTTPRTPLQPPLEPVAPPATARTAPEAAAAGRLAAHHLPPVPADLPALPSQLGSSQLAVAERPEPTLVRRALACLAQPLPEFRDVPSLQELLLFNELLGFRLRAAPAPAPRPPIAKRGPMPQPAPQPAQSIHLSRSASALPALGGGPPALPPQLPVGVMGRSTSSPASMYAPRDAGVLLDSQPLAPAAGVNGAVLAGLLPLGPPSAPPPCGTPPLRGSGGSSTLVVPCVDAAGRTGNLLVILPAGA